MGMYIRTTRRRTTDGSVVRYVQLAHNRRVDGVTRATVLVNLGREDLVDREGLRRLAESIHRYLGDEPPAAGTVSNGRAERESKPRRKTTAKAPRLAPGEGRERFLAAARELFAEKHYSGTSTREIAERAGIADALLFRNFGSKSALFAEAVLGPIREFARTWEEFQARAVEMSDVELGYEFVARFYDVLWANRRLIMSYIAESAVDPDILPLEESPLFVDTVRALVDWCQRAFEDRPATSVDPEIGARASIGMFLSMALFDDWFAGGDVQPRRAEVIDELVYISRFGITRERIRRTGAAAQTTQKQSRTG